jgi:hypothetical protein
MSDAHKFTYANGVVTMGPTQELGLPIDQTTWAGCGDFSQRNAPLNATHLPCDKNREAPTFDWPTPDWVAGLSTNPADILAQLTIGQQGRPPLSLPIRALTTGVFTAKARAAIYQAVAMMPGVYGLQNVPNPDGKIGYALGVHLRGGTNDELLIDPTDGTYLGERTYDPKTGAVTKFSSMRYGVADAEGAMPK